MNESLNAVNETLGVLDDTLNIAKESLVSSKGSVFKSVEYIIPEDSIQCVFFIVIIGLAVLAYLLVRINAKESGWAENVKKKLDDEGNSVEETSVAEMAELVSTRSERFAEILPNVALIIGLFGTFLGIGCALGDAGKVIANADTGASLSGVLLNLREALSGMGAQFKSSIYGVLCYLIFSFVYNAMGTSGKRVRFCSTLINCRIKEKENFAEEKASKQQAHLASLFSNLTKDLKDTLVSGSDACTQSLSRQSEMLSNLLNSVINGISQQREKFEQMQTENAQQNSSLLVGFECLGNKLEDTFKSAFNDQRVVLEQCFSSLTKSLQTELNEEKLVLERIVGTQRDGLNALKETYNDGFQNQRQTLQGCFDSQKGVLESCFNDQKNVLNNQHETLISGFAKQKDALVEGFEKQRETFVDGFTKQREALEAQHSDLSKGLNDQVLKMMEQNNSLKNGFDELNKNLKAGFEEEKETLKECFEAESGNLTACLATQNETLTNATDKQMIAIEEATRKQMAAIEAATRKQMNVISTDLLAIQKSLVDVNDETIKLIDSINKSTESFDKSAKNLSSGIESSVTNLKDEVSKIIDSTEVLKTSAASMSDAAVNLKDSSSRLSPAIMETLGKVESSIMNTLIDAKSQLDKSIVESGERISNSGTHIKIAVDEMSKKNGEGISELRSVFSDMLSKNVQSLDALVERGQKHLQEINSSIVDNQDALKESLDCFQKWMDESVDSLNGSTSMIEKLSESNKDLLNQIKNSINDRFSEIGSSNKSIEKTLQATNGIFESKLKSLNEVRSRIEDSLNDIRVSMAGYCGQGEETTSAIRDSLMNYNSQLGKMFDSIRDAVSAFKNKSTDLQDATQALLDQVAKNAKGK